MNRRPIKNTILSKLIGFIETIDLGKWYVVIPIRWKVELEENPDDCFVRYEARFISIQRHTSSQFRCYKWRYDGRNQYLLASFGVCVAAGGSCNDRDIIL